MVASDLQTGDVVCIRLQRFTTAMANLAAVPLLAPAPPAGDGPLLPHDFGVDEGTAYLVREFVTANSLQQLLDEPPAPSPLEIVTILRRGGDALLAAAEQGFSHPGLALRHLLLTADGTVRISGYDHLHPGRLRVGAREGEMLALLVPQALAGAGSADPQGTVAVHSLLRRCQTWQTTEAPRLEAVVHQLRQCEQQMLGYSRLGEAWQQTGHSTAALVRRCRHLGPLLHPYLIVLALVTAIIAFAAHTLTSQADPGRLVVYPIPTQASNDGTSTYFYANPPQVLTTTDATVSTATSPLPTLPATAAIPRIETASAPIVTTALPARRVAAVAPVRRVYPAPPAQPPRAVRYMPTATHAQLAVTRSVATAPAPSRATMSQATTGTARSTVIVTRLTAQQTTARVTVIAATTEMSSIAISQTARQTATTSTRVTTASALHRTAATRTQATPTASKGNASIASSTVTKRVVVLR